MKRVLAEEINIDYAARNEKWKGRGIFLSVFSGLDDIKSYVDAVLAEEEEENAGGGRLNKSKSRRQKKINARDA